MSGGVRGRPGGVWGRRPGGAPRRPETWSGTASSRPPRTPPDAPGRSYNKGFALGSLASRFRKSSKTPGFCWKIENTMARKCSFWLVSSKAFGPTPRSRFFGFARGAPPALCFAICQGELCAAIRRKLGRGAFLAKSFLSFFALFVFTLEGNGRRVEAGACQPALREVVHTKVREGQEPLRDRQVALTARRGTRPG